MGDEAVEGEVFFGGFFHEFEAFFVVAGCVVSSSCRHGIFIMFYGCFGLAEDVLQFADAAAVFCETFCSASAQWGCGALEYGVCKASAEVLLDLFQYG